MGDRDSSNRAARLGVVYGLAAYSLWGVFPLYFKLLFNAGITPLEVLAHRIAWSFLLLLAVVTVHRRWAELLRALGNRRVVLTLFTSTILIALNWLTFLHAVDTDQVLQSSLGYFLTPLANVVIGVTLLGERLRFGQVASLALACVGVAIMVAAGGELPWIALLLAITFAFYGFCRKTVAVDSMLGLTVETALLSPISFGWIAYLYATGDGKAATPTLWGMLLFSGAATALPLLLFASAARRLRFVTMGFLQYVGPTIQFLVAVFALGEPFSSDKVTSFAFIWLAVALYAVDSLFAVYRPRPTAAAVDLPAE